MTDPTDVRANQLKKTGIAHRLCTRLDGPWDFWKGLMVLVAFVGLYTVGSLGHMLWVKHTVGFEGYFGNGHRMPVKLLIAGQFIKAVCILAVVWILALRLNNLNWNAVGFVSARRRWYVIAILIALSGLVFRIFLAKSIVHSVPEWARFTGSPAHWGDAPGFTMSIFLLMTILVTPIAEEIFFRGFLFQWMATHRPMWLAALVSSVMFGVSHIIPAQAISAALMSLLIIFLYAASGSLWPPIVCHISSNLLSITLNLLAAEGLLPQFLTPPSQ